MIQKYDKETARVMLPYEELLADLRKQEQMYAGWKILGQAAEAIEELLINRAVDDAVIEHLQRRSEQ
jgi:hypothetical protein